MSKQIRRTCVIGVTIVFVLFQMYLAGQIPDKSMRDANGRRIVIDMNQFMAVEAEGPLS